MKHRIGDEHRDNDEERNRQERENAVDQEEFVIRDRRRMQVDLPREEIGQQASRRAGRIPPAGNRVNDDRTQHARHQIEHENTLLRIDKMPDRFQRRDAQPLPEVLPIFHDGKIRPSG